MATFSKSLVQIPACRLTILSGDFRDFLLYSSPNIVRIKSRRMRLVEHVPHIGRIKMRTWFWWGNLKTTDQLEDIGVDGRITLKCILKKWDRRS